MEYHEAATLLFDLRRYPPRPGVEATAALLDHLDDPHENVPCVQVAGSNGKGTTARMTTEILRSAGLRVGLYTSPHFESVRERVRVDGRPISKAAVTEYAGDVEGYLRAKGAEGDSPTFFEALTAMALWEFDRQDVDVAVLEVGIGGRLDATSAVDPVTSAVTSVTLEHTEFLGDTVAEIARDKAHVAPADGPLVTAADGEALAGIREITDDVLTVGDADGAGERDVAVAYGGAASPVEASVELAGADWAVQTRIPTPGGHQARNAGVAAALAYQVSDRLDVPVDPDDVARGLRGAHWPGRFEVMERAPMVVLDGAHNPGACEALADTLAEFDYADLHLVFGALVDKDHRGMVEALPAPESVVTCQPTIDRAEDEAVLAAVFEDHAVSDVSATRDVGGAVERALSRADPDDCVLVTGSLHTVTAARRRYTRHHVRKDVEDIDEAESVLSAADVPTERREEAAPEAVHRVVATRLSRSRARQIQTDVRAVGGEAVLSGVDDPEESREVVLLGTQGQFEALLERLADRGTGDSVVAREIRATLDLGSSGASGDDSATPWDDPPWADGTAVMGILNITPDSFHDGGEYNTVEDARRRAREMIEAGVDVLDVGGESTRPGADPVPVEEEKRRVVPVIEAIADEDALISVDTRKAEVARAAVDAGADIINDVSGLEDPEMRFVAAESGAGLVVMHSIETPVAPDRDVEYDDVVSDVLATLSERVLLADRAGVPRDRILVDPGLGFGKESAESFELLDRLDEFHALGCPVMVGHSHKSMFGLVGYESGERGPATVAATALAADRGADLVRVHDGPANVAAVRTALAAADPEQFEDGTE